MSKFKVGDKVIFPEFKEMGLWNKNHWSYLQENTVYTVQVVLNYDFGLGNDQCVGVATGGCIPEDAIILASEAKPYTVNGYVEFLVEYGGWPKGTIAQVIYPNHCAPSCCTVSLPYKGVKSDPCNLTKYITCKWLGMEKPVPKCSDCNDTKELTSEAQLGGVPASSSPCPSCTEPTATERDLFLKEVNRRYPVGTKFHPAHCIGTNKYCIVTEDCIYKVQNNGDIYSGLPGYLLYDEGKNPKYGGTDLNRVLYCASNKRWAPIVPLEKPAEHEPCNGEGREQDTSESEDLLAEAKRRYPIGTHYHSVPTHKKYTAKYEAKWVNSNQKSEGIEVGFGYVYQFGKWAEIVVLPTAEKKEVNPLLKYAYSIVHCTNQEELDFVTSSLKIKRIMNIVYVGEIGVAFKAKDDNRYAGWTSLFNWKLWDSKIYSFTEWCQISGHDFSKKETTVFDDDLSWLTGVPEKKESDIEELLRIAAEKYPIGTKYMALRSQNSFYQRSIEEAKILPNKFGAGIEVGRGYVYLDETKQWAEIISQSSATNPIMHCSSKPEQNPTFTRVIAEEIFIKPL